MKIYAEIFVALIITVGFNFCSNPKEKICIHDDYKNQILIKEIQKVLDDEINLWYPLCLDTVYGGYFSDINY